MFELFRQVGAIAVPVFVVSTMLNVGLTQRPATIVRCLRSWRFVLRMLVANFVAAPLAMLLIVHVLGLAPAFEAGLIIYSLSAGAPFLIKLTEAAEHNVALGAATMLVLMIATVVLLPLTLPWLIEGTYVSGAAIARTLLVQMVLPLVGGMVAARVVPRVVEPVQPWVGHVGAISLYVVIVAIIVGFLPDTLAMVGSGAILGLILFSVAAFGFGWLAGAGDDALEDIGGLGTTQRNNAAALLVAADNFEDPAVLVVIAVGSTLILLALLPLARRLARDNVPTSAASAPQSRESGS